MKLERYSASDLGKIVKNKTISPKEILKYFEDRIAKRNPSINAFVYTKFEDAYKEAEKLENTIMHSAYQDLAPFTGVPFGLKDFLPNKPGWTNSHGGVECLISTDNCYSEFCLAMEKAGGIAIGKTNAPAYGFRGTTDNKLYGPTRNPFNTELNSGGSSGGSAAAVADGLVPIAEGGDAGGSIRIPASWCNLFGFKPGVGTVPSVIRPDAWSATHPFCFNFALTKTVEDAKNLLKYMAYFNPRDPFSHDLSNYKYNFKRTGKIAVTLDFDLFAVAPEIRSMLKKVAKNLADLGYTVDFVKFNFKHTSEEMSKAWCQALIFDSVIEIEQDKKAGRDYISEHLDQFPEEITYWIDVCKNSTIWDLYNFNLIRTDILDEFENKFEEYDYIVSPTSCCLPARNSSDNNTKGPEYIDGKKIDPLIGWSTTYLVNFTGHPAASIPAGLSSEELPIGFQVIGRKYSDNQLLDFSKSYEEAFPWIDNYEIPFNRII